LPGSVQQYRAVISAEKIQGNKGIKHSTKNKDIRKKYSALFHFLFFFDSS
jgi:hypothetical protein